MIKDAKIIYPQTIGEIGLNYLPIYNDRHILNLKLWSTIDNDYRVSGMFFETNNRFISVFELVKSNDQNSSDLKTIVIIGSFLVVEPIIVETVITRLPDEFTNEFTQLTVPILPRWGEHIIARKSNVIVLFKCVEVIIKTQNKLPLLKLDCWGVYNDEKELLRSYGISDLQWSKHNAQ